MARRLRSGYTTGACAAAAAKAAAMLLVRSEQPATVDIPFPDGSRVTFVVHRASREERPARSMSATASVIKDAGDDPDVTNGAEIVACARMAGPEDKGPNLCVTGPEPRVRLCGGKGVGRVTKPGLAVTVGEPAINPVPREMICAALREVLAEVPAQALEVTISVPRGEELAQKTLNRRLGIVGGLSILGTTGIVRPVSAAAWTATIKASLDVAKEAGLREVVLSTGRTSEKAAQSLLALPEEAYAMMGDYLEFSLIEASRRGFRKIHLAGMWAKIMKAAMGVPQTHVRHGALEVEQALAFLGGLGAGREVLAELAGSNTAREIYQRLVGLARRDLVKAVCLRAKAHAEEVTGGEVSVYLVSSSAMVLEHV